jgi:hypothetical protein
MMCNALRIHDKSHKLYYATLIARGSGSGCGRLEAMEVWDDKDLVGDGERFTVGAGAMCAGRTGGGGVCARGGPLGMIIH